MSGEKKREQLTERQLKDLQTHWKGVFDGVDGKEFLITNEWNKMKKERFGEGVDHGKCVTWILLIPITVVLILVVGVGIITFEEIPLLSTVMFHPLTAMRLDPVKERRNRRIETVISYDNNCKWNELMVSEREWAREMEKLNRNFWKAGPEHCVVRDLPTYLTVAQLKDYIAFSQKQGKYRHLIDKKFVEGLGLNHTEMLGLEPKNMEEIRKNLPEFIKYAIENLHRDVWVDMVKEEDIITLLQAGVPILNHIKYDLEKAPLELLKQLIRFEKHIDEKTLNQVTRLLIQKQVK